MVTSEKVSWHLHAGPQGTQGLSGALCTMGSTAVVGEDGRGQPSMQSHEHLAEARRLLAGPWLLLCSLAHCPPTPVVEGKVMDSCNILICHVPYSFV